MKTDLSDRAQLRLIKAQIETVLESVSEDISFTVGKISFEHDGSGFTTKITALRKNADGTTTSPEMKTWIADAFLYDLDPAWSDKVVDGETIVGLNHNARKYPVLVKHANGQTYKHATKDILARWA